MDRIADECDAAERELKAPIVSDAAIQKKNRVSKEESMTFWREKGDIIYWLHCMVMAVEDGQWIIPIDLIYFWKQNMAFSKASARTYCLLYGKSWGII